MRTEAQKERAKIARRIWEARPEVRKKIQAYRISHPLTDTQTQARKEYCRLYYAGHRKQLLARSCEYGRLRAEKKRRTTREWCKNNPNKVKARYKRDKMYPARIIALTSRTRLRKALKSAGAKNANQSLDLIGCTPIELVAHLERLFKPGMTWGNYGLHGWHVDHKMPCKAFDLTKPEEQKKCFHYTNLQPLWAKENWTKSAKIILNESLHLPQSS